MKKFKGRKTGENSVTNHPMVLIRCIGVNDLYDETAEAIAFNATPPQVLTAAEKVQLAAFLREPPVLSPNSFYIAVELLGHNALCKEIDGGRRQMALDKKKVEAQVEAERKRRLAVEKARKTKRLQRLEALAKEAEAL